MSTIPTRAPGPKHVASETAVALRLVDQALAGALVALSAGLSTVAAFALLGAYAFRPVFQKAPR